MPRLPLPPSPTSKPRRRDEAAATRINKRKAAGSTKAGAGRAWQRMVSGRRLHLLDPSALDIEIEDIAHGLARVARWNGQTNGAHIFSVAQHTLLVEAVMRVQSPRIDARPRPAAP